jgi:hypothetical protein
MILQFLQSVNIDNDQHFAHVILEILRVTILSLALQHRDEASRELLLFGES